MVTSGSGIGVAVCASGAPSEIHSMSSARRDADAQTALVRLAAASLPTMRSTR
jgi:hypothetical protein